MAELGKIIRVLKKLDPTAPHECLLVLDATIGQNALQQVETFLALVQVNGLVLTKLDGTARGGVLVALAERFRLPVRAIGRRRRGRGSAAVRGRALRALTAGSGRERGLRPNREWEMIQRFRPLLRLHRRARISHGSCPMRNGGSWQRGAAQAMTPRDRDQRGLRGRD